MRVIIEGQGAEVIVRGGSHASTGAIGPSAPSRGAVGAVGAVTDAIDAGPAPTGDPGTAHTATAITTPTHGMVDTGGAQSGGAAPGAGGA
jgi:hypothetical protein